MYCSLECLAKECEELPTLKPLKVPVPGIGELDVIAFYAPGSGLTPMDRRTGGAPFANFWPLAPHSITVVHNSTSGTFHNTEAAYQSLKWWQHDATRKEFEGCVGAGLDGGEQAFTVKRRIERGYPRSEELDVLAKTNFDGLGKFDGMMLVLRHKWRLPGFKELLLSTDGMYMVEHCPIKGRDLVWTDNFTGGGENKLGAALMKVREELLREEGKTTDGWPKGVERPEYLGNTASNNWQAVVDTVAQHLAGMDSCTRPGCFKPRSGRSQYCSMECMESAEAESSGKQCARDGCTNPPSGTSKFCCLDCMEA